MFQLKAVISNNYNMTNTLKNSGADLNSQDFFEFTPLDYGS